MALHAEQIGHRKCLVNEITCCFQLLVLRKNLGSLTREENLSLVGFLYSPKQGSAYKQALLYNYMVKCITTLKTLNPVLHWIKVLMIFLIGVLRLPSFTLNAPINFCLVLFMAPVSPA